MELERVMTNTTNIDSVTTKPTVVKSRRSAFDWSLIFGIGLIALFVCLFALEFSNILSLHGRVNHTSTAMPVQETAPTGNHST